MAYILFVMDWVIMLECMYVCSFIVFRKKRKYNNVVNIIRCGRRCTCIHRGLKGALRGYHRSPYIWGVI